MDAVLAFAHGRSLRVLAREPDRDRVLAGVEGVTEEQFVKRVDAVIALGGDIEQHSCLEIGATSPPELRRNVQSPDPAGSD